MRPVWKPGSTPARSHLRAIEGSLPGDPSFVEFFPATPDMGERSLSVSLSIPS